VGNERYFIDLSDRYDHDEIQSIPQVVDHICQLAAAASPIIYTVKIRDQNYDIIPASAGLEF